MIKAVLFDLDETLYDEFSYVVSGFRSVAVEIARQTGIHTDEIQQQLLIQLKHHGRGRVFDHTLAQLGIVGDAELIQSLVHCYRQHRPDIHLYADADAVLTQLQGNYKLAVVTDGLLEMQQRKVEALGITQRTDAVVYCWENAMPKPDKGGFVQALQHLGVKREETIIVGDRPDHDLAAAAKIPCRAVRIRRGRYAQTETAPFEMIAEMPDLNGLPELLDTLNN